MSLLLAHKAKPKWRDVVFDYFVLGNPGVILLQNTDQHSRSSDHVVRRGNQRLICGDDWPAEWGNSVIGPEVSADCWRPPNQVRAHMDLVKRATSMTQRTKWLSDSSSLREAESWGKGWGEKEVKEEATGGVGWSEEYGAGGRRGERKNIWLGLYIYREDIWVCWRLPVVFGLLRLLCSPVVQMETACVWWARMNSLNTLKWPPGLSLPFWLKSLNIHPQYRWIHLCINLQVLHMLTVKYFFPSVYSSDLHISIEAYNNSGMCLLFHQLCNCANRVNCPCCLHKPDRKDDKLVTF